MCEAAGILSFCCAALLLREVRARKVIGRSLFSKNGRCDLLSHFDGSWKVKRDYRLQTPAQEAIQCPQDDICLPTLMSEN